MKKSNKKKIILSLAAMVAGLIMYLIPDFLEIVNMPYIIAEVLRLILAFGVVALFGFLYYGKDKRIFRFIFAFSFLTTSSWLFFPVIKIINDLISDIFYIDQAYAMQISFLCGGIVSFLLSLKLNGTDEIFCRSDNEDQTFRKNYSCEKAVALICGLPLVATRIAGYVFIRIFAPLTFALEGEMTNLGADIGDLLASLVIFGLCYALCFIFVRDKKAILYCVGFFFFVYNLSLTVSAGVTDIISVLINTDITTSAVSFIAYNIIPSVISIAVALAAGILIARFLTASEKESS